MGLREVDIRLSYISKGMDNIVDSFLIPALSCSKVYKRSVGFFSSSVFELLGVGFEKLIENNGTIQVICSPELSEEDVKAIKLGYKLKAELKKEAINKDIENVLSELSNDNLLMLSTLISKGILNVIVVDVIDSIGMYHDKLGYFEDGFGEKVLFVGSANESSNAYIHNYEKIRVSMSWREGDLERIEDEMKEFDGIWNGTNEFIKKYEYNDLLGRYVHKEMKSRGVSCEEEESNSGITLRSYQNEAISKWQKNGNKGFLVMATGTGKTWTAIYAALEIIKNEKILLVICAPYKHLVKQWYDDVKKVLPENDIVMVSSENPKWENELLDAIYSSKYIKKETIVVISTIKSFQTDKFYRVAEKAKMNRMLIVDEAHRFKSLNDEYKKQYAYMLGLSATPFKNSKDEFGNVLMDYFGGQVFNLPIEYAIEKNYLVHYDYYPIYVEATIEEENDFEKYSRAMASCFKNGKCVDPDGLARYKRSRLRVISMAEEKMKKIKYILSHIKENDHFIVYCGDGKLFSDSEGEEIRHIQFVKDELADIGYKSSQFTSEESMIDRMKLVNNFNKGLIDSMVAIRCLDEGINIPSIKGALLLSSNDDYREFIQRRGRILRKYTDKYTSEVKEKANIYDVIVLPPFNQSFAIIELRRMYEYARLADNQEEVFREIDDLLSRYGIEESQIMYVDENEEELDE